METAKLCSKNTFEKMRKIELIEEMFVTYEGCCSFSKIISNVNVIHGKRPPLEKKVFQKKAGKKGSEQWQVSFHLIRYN